MPGIGVGVGVGFGGRRRRSASAAFGALASAYYYGVAATVPVTATAGLDCRLWINAQLAASFTGTGAAQNVAVTPTLAMCGAAVNVVVTTVPGIPLVVATGVLVYAPTLLGAKLGGWWDESSTFDASGWAPVSGGGVLTSAALPTTSTRNGRRTLVTNGSSQYAYASFARNQATETFVACKPVGAAPAATASIFSGNGNAGYIARLITGDSNARCRAGANLDFTFASSPNNRWLVLGARFAGASSFVWENNVQRATGDAGATALGGLTIGGNGGAGSAFCAAEYGEAIVTAAGQTLTDDERTALHAYLTAKAWV